MSEDGWPRIDWRSITLDRVILCVVTAGITTGIVALAHSIIEPSEPRYQPPEVPRTLTEPVPAILKRGEVAYGMPSCMVVDLNGSLFLVKDCPLSWSPGGDYQMTILRTERDTWEVDCMRCNYIWRPKERYNFMEDIPIARASFARRP